MRACVRVCVCVFVCESMCEFVKSFCVLKKSKIHHRPCALDLSIKLWQLLRQIEFGRTNRHVEQGDDDAQNQSASRWSIFRISSHQISIGRFVFRISCRITFFGKNILADFLVTNFWTTYIWSNFGRINKLNQVKFWYKNELIKYIFY